MGRTGQWPPHVVHDVAEQPRELLFVVRGVVRGVPQEEQVHGHPHGPHVHRRSRDTLHGHGLQRGTRGGGGEGLTRVVVIGVYVSV